MTVCLISFSSKVNDSRVELFILETEICDFGPPEFFIECYVEISVRSRNLLIKFGLGPVLKCSPGHDSMFDFIIVKS